MKATTKIERNIEKQIRKLNNQLEAIRSPKRLAVNKKLLGRCFVYQNSYGSGKSWPLYTIVVAADDMGLELFQFEDTGSRIEIRRKEFVFNLNHASYKEITFQEFISAWNDFIGKCHCLPHHVDIFKTE